jgi:hypothetical protein
LYDSRATGYIPTANEFQQFVNRMHTQHKGNLMQDIKLNLTIDDINMILEGLGNFSFSRAQTLVGKIREQVSRQITSPNDASMRNDEKKA